MALGHLYRRLTHSQNGTKQMTAILVELPADLFVDLKDFPQQRVSTQKMDNVYVRNALVFALKRKLEAAKNAGGQETSDANRRENIEKMRKALEEEFELRTGSAAKLTEVEEEFRVILAGHFENARQKSSEAAKLARAADRLQNFRDLVVKRKYQELGEERSMEELNEKAGQLFFQMEQLAQRRVEAIKAARQEMQIEF